MVVDATCAPQNIRFPQDVNILNEGREKLENSICSICYIHNLYRPRMYRRNGRRDYLNFARSRKKIRKAIKKQLSYLKRDLDHVRWLADYGYEADCLEVERAFSLSKRSFGMGLIRTRLEGTTRSSIALSIIAMNIDKLAKAFLFPKTVLVFSGYSCGTKTGILLFIPHNRRDYRMAA